MDLAEALSSGAASALDLAPFDERFARLQREVLSGGASRFAPAVATDEPVRYVIGVGIPLEHLHFGALIVQASRVGLVWRDAAGASVHRVAHLGHAAATTSPVELGGERWTHYQVTSPQGELGFLAPPTATSALNDTLQAVFSSRASVPAAGSTAWAPTSPAAVAGPTESVAPRSPSSPTMVIYRPEGAERVRPEQPVTYAAAPTPSSWPTQVVAPTPVPATRPGPSRTLQGFLVGLLGTVALGAVVALAASLLG